mmetsp:Transcript_46540/g.110689  ORF Transcript_46540/g.110689 Transcript_46540/m.110689 type:complete len:204 (-) Transcript_46540:318-929(-)
MPRDASADGGFEQERWSGRCSSFSRSRTNLQPARPTINAILSEQATKIVWVKMCARNAHRLRYLMHPQSQGQLLLQGSLSSRPSLDSRLPLLRFNHELCVYTQEKARSCVLIQSIHLQVHWRLAMYPNWKCDAGSQHSHLLEQMLFNVGCRQFHNLEVVYGSWLHHYAFCHRHTGTRHHFNHLSIMQTKASCKRLGDLQSCSA